MFSTKAKFVHRRNADGTYDSICTACIMTAASVEAESQLPQLELGHVCNPVNLLRFRRGVDSASPKSDSNPQNP